MKAFFMFSFLLISVLCISGTQILSTSLPSKHFSHADECNALLQFKNSLTIYRHYSINTCLESDWGYTSSVRTDTWKEGTDCCTDWDGISCDNVTGNVITVLLPCSYLQGTLHNNNSLFSLHHLDTLSLSGNYLTGPIPSSICRVSSLKYLDLSDNALNGTILPCFGNLSSLEYLDLSGNALIGSLPRTLTNCTSFWYLSVTDNTINDTFPFWLASLNSSLSWLQLSNNYFHGRIASGNSPFPLPFLDILFIAQNQFYGQLPPQYFQFSHMSAITLASNMFDGFVPIPPINIEAYSLSGNRFTGKIPPSFCNTTALFRAEMSYNSLSGKIPQCLVTSTKLEILDLSNNNFSVPLPEIPHRNNCSLKSVALHKNHLEGELPRSLALCEHFEALDLSSNELEDSFPTWLGAQQSLSILILRSNKFYGQITSDLKAVHPFPKLKISDISNNNFIGPVPTQYISRFNSMMGGNKDGILTFEKGDWETLEGASVIYKGVEMELYKIREALVIIDLSHNHFQDQIPNIIGNLKLLKGLNLSHNNLRGAIPYSLENLTNLEWLDLSSNNLTGEIPALLTSLPSLAIFNVSINNLTGKVPKGKQFNTFRNDSYMGNPGLCGLPLSKPCAEEHPLETPSAYRNEDDADRGMSGWRAALMGYGTGIVIGISIG